MVAARHHRLEAVRAHRFRDRLGVGRHDDAAEPAFRGALGDMDDHRPAGNVGQRLARQPGRGHAGRDQDKGGHRSCKRARKGVIESGKTSHWKPPL